MSTSVVSAPPVCAAATGQTPGGGRPGRGRDRLIGYGLPVFAAIAVTFTWFSPGAFIASGDIPPFEVSNTASELGSLWNHQSTGTGSTSYAVSRLGVVAIAEVARLLGLSPMLAQHLHYALVWGFAAFGAAYLAAVWIRRPAAIAAAGLVGAFNMYLLINHPLPLPAVAIGLVGLLVGLLLRAAASPEAAAGDSAPVAGTAPARAVRLRAFVLASLLASVLADNPPLLAVCLVSVLAATAGARLVIGPGATGRAVRFLVRATPLVLVVNLWWLVPYAITLVSWPGLQLAASTDILDWAWTQTRASMTNVVTLNPTWGWLQLSYFPYRLDMEAGGWPALAWALPALAGLGVVIVERARRWLAWLLGFAGVVLAVVGTGQHPPFAALNLWLLEHLPGGWLLRDPAMKLGVLQVLGYAVLVAIAVDRLLGLPGSRAIRLPAHAVAAVLTIAAVAYPWPLWTGAVVPVDRSPLPGSRVSVPASWYQLAASVNAAAAPGKVLVLPLNRFYQVTTDWGYHGADTIPNQLLTRPVIQPLPGGYFRPAGSAETLIGGVQRALLAGDIDGARRGLAALGVGQVVIRKDLLDTGSPPVDVGLLRRTAGQALRPAGAFAVADVYRVPAAAGAVSAYGSVATVVGDGGVDDWAVLPPVRAQVVATTTAGVGGDEVIWRPGGEPAFTVSSAGTYRFDQSAITPVYRASVIRTGRTAALRLTDAVQAAVDGSPLPARTPMTVSLGRRPVAFATNGELRASTADPQLIQLAGATTITAYGADRTSRAARLGPLGDCAKADAADAHLTREFPDPTTVRLGADAHSACVTTPAPPSTSGVYLVRLRYQQVSGRPARICLWQTSLRRCAELPALPVGPGWHTYRAATAVARGSGRVLLFLYADGSWNGHTVTQYADVHVDPLHRTARTTVTPSAPAVVERQLSAGRHRVDARVAAPSTLDAPRELGDCNNVGGQTPAQLGLGLQAGPDGLVRLTAPAHIACVQLTAQEPLGVRYRLNLEYRTVTGRPARVCLWQAGPDRCAPLPDLAAGSAWTRLSTTVEPDVRSQRLSLYLYADGQREPATVVEFRRASLALEPEFGVHIYPTTAPPSPPRIAVHQLGPAEVSVGVRGATGTFALVLAEAAAPGWRLRGLPAGWSARPFTANGYAQAWLVSGRGDAALSIDYGPAGFAYAGYAVSAVTVAGLLGLAMWPAIARRRRRRHPLRGYGGVSTLMNGFRR